MMMRRLLFAWVALALCVASCTPLRPSRHAGAYFGPATTTTPGGSTVGTAANLAQNNWYIDPSATGCGGAGCADTNDGKTALTALKTHAELEARWGYGGKLTNDALTYYGGPTTTLFSGASAARTGTISSVTAQAASTNTPLSFVDTTLSSWTPYLTKRIRPTSGANVGKWAWLAKDLGGGLGAARVRASSPNTKNAIGAFSNADPYQVDTQIAITLGDVNPTSNAGQTIGATHVFILSSLPSSDPVNVRVSLATLQFQDFEISVAGFNALILQFATQNTGITGHFVGCKFDPATLYISTTSQLSFQNCFFQAYFFNNGPGIVNIFGGLLSDPLGIGSGIYAQGGMTDLGVNFMLEGTDGIAAPNGAVQITGAAVFDSLAFLPYNQYGSALVVGAGTADTGNNGTSGTATLTSGALWGSGNQGYGIEVFAGHTAMLGGAQYAVGNAGVGGFILGSDAANMRAFNDSTGVYSAPVTGTWANFSTAVGSGGFGGNAHNVAKNAHLVTGP